MMECCEHVPHLFDVLMGAFPKNFLIDAYLVRVIQLLGNLKAAPSHGVELPRRVEEELVGKQSVTCHIQHGRQIDEGEDGVDQQVGVIKVEAVNQKGHHGEFVCQWAQVRCHEGNVPEDHQNSVQSWQC